MVYGGEVMAIYQQPLHTPNDDKFLSLGDRQWVLMARTREGKEGKHHAQGCEGPVYWLVGNEGAGIDVRRFGLEGTFKASVLAQLDPSRPARKCTGLARFRQRADCIALF